METGRRPPGPRQTLRMRTILRTTGWLLVAVLALAALLTLDPARVGLSGTTPVLQAIALRGVLAAAGGALAAVVLLGALVAALLRWRTASRQLLVLGLVAVLAAAVHAAVPLGRGTSGQVPAPSAGSDAEGSFDVLTLNTLGVAGGTGPVAELLAERMPEVAALQEILPEDAEEIAERVAEAGGPDYQVLTDNTRESSVSGTALLVDPALGEYTQVPHGGTTFASVRARPSDPALPELLSVHPVPPVPPHVGTWRSELDALTALCDQVPGLVMAGDLNATLDHAPLRDASCLDAARAAGAGGEGTWPAGRPRWQGAPIDHVLVDGATWTPVAAAVLDTPGASDHRPVLVRLEPAVG